MGEQIEDIEMEEEARCRRKLRESEEDQKLIFEFSKKVSKVMIDLSSSHVFFIIQQAFGDCEWEEAIGICHEIQRITKG